MRATFELTVPMELYESVCARCDQDFADSYLTGAMLRGSSLIPRTLTGYYKMLDRTEFRHLLKDAGISLIKPTPFEYDGTRLTFGEKGNPEFRVGRK